MTKNKTKTPTLAGFLLLLLFISFHAVTAQDTVLQVSFNGRLDSIHSEILKQKRLIQVFIPRDYKPGSNTRYDVLYVLDGGNWNTGLITQMQHFAQGQGYVPPMIIVSVLGIDRNKDLTPTHIDSWKTSGGGENFLRFIKNELIPHVNRTYPSNGDNTLWGHSLGGMFVVYSMLKEPTIFKSYIAVDPSIWWDKNYVAKVAAGNLSSLAGMNSTLFISGRPGRSLSEMKIDTLEVVLKNSAPKDLTWKIEPYADESHSSIRMKSTYDGLKFTYAGMTGDIEFHPMSGLMIKDKPIKIWYFNDTTKVRYTLNGAVPTTTSDKVKPEVLLTGPAKVTYKKFSRRSSYNKSVSGDFAIGSLRSVPKKRNMKPGGFTYTYYEGDWDTWPDLKGLVPAQTGITDNTFDIDKLPRKKNYALTIDGFLEAKEDGYYILLLEADKDSKLYLGSKLLIHWNGDYNRRTASYILPLSKGFYPIRVEYLHKNEDFQLKMQYLTPGTMESKQPRPIPLEAQYSIQKD